MEIFKEVVGQVGAQEAPPHWGHRSWLFSCTRGRHNVYNDALRHEFRLAKISDVTLDVKVSLGSYEGVFIDIEDAAFKMCPSTMMRNSSRVILSIPRLSGVDDGEYRRRVVCRVARGLGRARSHPTDGLTFSDRAQLSPGRDLTPKLLQCDVTSSPQLRTTLG